MSIFVSSLGKVMYNTYIFNSQHNSVHFLHQYESSKMIFVNVLIRLITQIFDLEIKRTCRGIPATRQSAILIIFIPSTTFDNEQPRIYLPQQSPSNDDCPSPRAFDR